MGDTGPGGGKVFYVHPSGTFACGATLTSTCKYLEAAPTDRSTGIAWCSDTTSALGTTATAIGTGMANTATADTTCTSGAIQIAADYAKNGKTDWYLPSKDELNELCKYARTQTIGDSSTTCNNTRTLTGSWSAQYWSSSEINTKHALRQLFGDGNQGNGFKGGTAQVVRPVRAFGGTLACADGGVCIVGDTGPGGGVVFYVSATNFTSTGSDCNTTCRYLEAAPADQSTGIVWATTAARCYLNASDLGLSDCQSNSIYSNAAGQDASRTAATAIGKGRANTNQIRARLTTAGGALTSTYAAGIAYAYANDGKTDWYLPSKDELNELCKYARTQTTGDTTVICANTGTLRVGFSTGYYWSSSEYGASLAWDQEFANGNQYYPFKGNSSQVYVRSVRAF